MEQRSHERGSCRPNFSLHENQCPITATETDADSLAWPSSDEYLTSHSASSGDETTARPCPFEENHCSSHQLEESSSDDASPEPSSSTRPCKQHTAEAFTSDGKPSSGLVPFQGQHEAKVHVASPDEQSGNDRAYSLGKLQRNPCSFDSLSSKRRRGVFLLCSWKTLIVRFNPCLRETNY